MSKTTSTPAESIQHIDPALIAAVDNTRYGLLPAKIEHLAGEILEAGEITNPLVVFPMPPDEHGHTYMLHQGHYRLAAAMMLNEKRDAGIRVPIIQREYANSLDRRKRQIGENVGRTDFSAMDKAVSMQALLDEGVERQEVRRIFALPGGRKGNKMQPLSNSSLNQHLSFLSLPTMIKDRIHDSRISVAGGWALTQKIRKGETKESITALIEEIEADRLKAIADEEAAEAKFLKSTIDDEEKNRKRQEVLDAAKVAQEEVVAKAEALKAKNEETVAALQASLGIEDPAEKKKAEAAMKETQEAARNLQKEKEKASKKAEQAQAKADALLKKEAEKVAARKSTPAPISDKTITKAAAKKGPILPSQQVDKPGMKEMRETFGLMAKNVKNPVSQKLGGIMLSWMGGSLFGKVADHIAIAVGDKEAPATKKK